jgi:tetratricopeptide (TPR) repeat protein
MKPFDDTQYLAGLTSGQQALLVRVNRAGVARLLGFMSAGNAVAFLGAGASTPIYPLWAGLVAELIDNASSRLTESEAATLHALARASPDGVVEILRKQLGAPSYRELLRHVFRARRDETSGRTWTETQELIVRCNFRGVVTTNYDPGIVEARMRVRPRAISTGFSSWTDDAALDLWRTDEIFSGADELPVLFAHGHHNQPDAIVLATTEYRRAYEGKLGDVLAGLFERGRLVWIGFSFADQRIAAILEQVTARSGPRSEPGAAPRHVALMPWDPEPADGRSPLDPAVLRSLSENTFGCHLVLYPASAENHSALSLLLKQFTDPTFPPVRAGATLSGAAPATPSLATSDSEGSRQQTGSDALLLSPPAPAMRWVHAGDPIEHFAGRADELARLDRWAADRSVRLVGVTAWGGAGKTALVTEWLVRRAGASQRPGVQGVFAWSFYDNPSEDEWARGLVIWARETFGVAPAGGRLVDLVLSLLQRVGLVLVLDGLEVLQEAAGGGRYGRLLGGLLRDVLTALCRVEHRGLAVLTSRFVFADLECFDGGAARMLDVPALTPAEGAELLARAGGGWLPSRDRLNLVRAVDGHALGVGALAGALADNPPIGELYSLLAELEQAGRTNHRVRRVLSFYAERLSTRDRAIIAIVSLFQRPIALSAVLVLGSSAVLDGALADSTPAELRAAVQLRLGGLLSLHKDASVSAHPLVRDTFRPLALNQASAQLASELTLDALPSGPVRSREDALRVAEIIELLLEADEWRPADELYGARTDDGKVFNSLPAAALGQRCALAFVATPARETACRDRLSPSDLGYYLNSVGLHANSAGDVVTAEHYLQAAVQHARQSAARENLGRALRNWAECLLWLGRPDTATDAASEALKIDRGLDSYACLAWAYDLSGDAKSADRNFIDADRIARRLLDHGHLASIHACW